MTRKQMKQFAKEIYKNELIHTNPNSSKEEKRIAEDCIMQITNQVMALKNGINLMLEIDTLVQELATQD